MANPSNLYAEKIFAEHPIALWTLDNDLKYLSLISDTNRSLVSWTYTSSAAGAPFDQTTPPYYKLGTTVTEVSKTGVVGTGSSSFTATSNFTFSSSEDTFTIGFYYFKTTPYISKLEIGYKIGAGAVQWSDEILTSDFYSWEFASATFNAQPTGANIVIRFTYNLPTVSDSVSILINGLSVGKWAEDANMESLGSVSSTIPATIPLTGTNVTAVEAPAYSSTTNAGYYVISDAVAGARSSSFPLVYGSSNSTVLSYNDGLPSLIVPGNGFLNESQKTKTRTFETWLRIKAGTSEAKKIIGPIVGNDGIYADGPHLILNIAGNTLSHYVGEWDRPMLLQVVTSISGAQMFINGDFIGAINYDIEDVALEEYFDGSSDIQDWIGFYCYTDIPRIEVSCVAIYAYAIDKVLAQKRFVYGQGTKHFQDELVSGYDGDSIFPDYSFANYGSNRAYGNNQKYQWTEGILSNCISETNILKSPKYTVPTIVLAPSATFTDEDLLLAQNSPYDHIDLQPTAGWNSTESHILFDNINPTINKTQGIYIVATRSENNTTKQILFKIFNKINGDYLEAYTIRESTTDKIIYKFSYNGTVSSALYTATGNVIGTKFAAGVVFQDLIDNVDPNFSEFFGNHKNLILYIGGDEAFTTDTTFTGKIYKFGFMDKRNLSKVSAEFDSDGFFTGTAATLDSHTASYTLFLNKFDSKIFLDIATNMYWQESIPLSFFAKYVEAPTGTKYALDYLQFNVDYPKPISFSSNEYNTSSSLARTYLTFQTLASGAEADVLTYNTSSRVTSSNVISSSSGYANTKYEMVDGTAIYIPTTADLETLAVVAHIEVNADSLVMKPIGIRHLQITGQGLNTDSSNPTEFGTSTGTNLIPYGNVSAAVLPKFTLPYYYLSSNSGMQITGTPSASNGYYININTELSDTFEIGFLQMVAKFNLEQFSTSDVLIFETVNITDNPDTKIRFYIDSVNTANTRARIFAKNESGTDYTDVEYYINGIKTEYPVVSLDEWFTLGIKFKTVYAFTSEAGTINISGPMLMNNFVYAQLKSGDEHGLVLVENIWINVLYDTNSLQTWNDYTTGVWSDIISQSSGTEIRGLSSEEIYKTFTGTSRNSAGGYASESYVGVDSFNYTIYTDVKSSQITIEPA
jgi:hypothetical protein